MMRLRFGKLYLKRRGAFRLLGDQGAGGDDPRAQLRVPRRIADIDPAAEHGNGRAAGLEGAAVRRGVDAERHAADHLDARGAQFTTDRSGDLDAAEGRASRADDRDAGCCRAGGAELPEPLGRGLEVGETRRPIGR